MLFQPEIPPNTGNIIRLSANTGAELHLIKPYGFDLDDKKMRRAGLDYHEYAGVYQYDNWDSFSSQRKPGRVFGISTKGENNYSELAFEEGDYVVFGPETRGLPESIRKELGKENLLRIPMLVESRSLNLSNAAAVIVYEAWRQLGFVDGQ